MKFIDSLINRMFGLNYPSPLHSRPFGQLCGSSFPSPIENTDMPSFLTGRPLNSHHIPLSADSSVEGKSGQSDCNQDGEPLPLSKQPSFHQSLSNQIQQLDSNPYLLNRSIRDKDGKLIPPYDKLRLYGLRRPKIATVSADNTEKKPNP
ncbi:MAG: hypothetical protein HYI21_13035 [Sediminibacterium sp. Gen4]|nr:MULTISPECIES: hypothetical protein [unclassified Sediminibacterium]MBW0161633.1 hypothetical protein [Sediminibacterium sp.]MBW0164417.1 hypothetical protein [Sediminibacterium sp.]NWK66949.1 hypothetical protein [Sediminibacterium sp. Gen4]